MRATSRLKRTSPHAPAPPAVKRLADAGRAEVQPQRLVSSLSVVPVVQRKCAACAAEDNRNVAARSQVKVGAMDDPHEREADSLAGSVMAKRKEGAVRRQGAGGGEELGASASELVAGGGPLPDATRRFYEARLGRDFSAVRLHHGTRAAALNDSIGARAFTYRHHVWLGKGQDATPSFTMAHELAHVMQQTAPAPALAGGAGHTGRAIAPPAVQRELKPPGNCVQGVHDGMQRMVKAWCDHPSGRHCTGTESCHRIAQKIRRNQMCAMFRRTINVQCYEGGDAGHRMAERDARRAQANCMSHFVAKCRKPPPSAPITEPAPEKKPVLDKSFMDRMAAITGLTGTALILYLIVSEGSRLFPPRNLIPVP